MGEAIILENYGEDLAVSVCGPNPEEWQVLGVSSAAEGERVCEIIEFGNFDCPRWGGLKTGHYGPCGDCLHCKAREYVDRVG